MLIYCRAHAYILEKRAGYKHEFFMYADSQKFPISVDKIIAQVPIRSFKEDRMSMAIILIESETGRE